MLKKPELIVEPYPYLISLIYNKFGDEDITGYNVYYGQSENSMQLIKTTTENYCNLLDELQNNTKAYFQVKAVYGNGTESEGSEIKMVNVNFIDPGSNLIKNGDFSSDDRYWNLIIESPAVARCQVNEAKQYYFDIKDKGSQLFSIQLEQRNIPLINGKDYIFEFDAIAETGRTAEIKIAKASDPWTNYSKIGMSYIPEEWKHFAYKFTMDDPTDFYARLVVNCGGTSDANVTVDNFSLRQDVETSSEDIVLHKNNIQSWFNGSEFHFSITGQHIENVSAVLYDLSGRKLNQQLRIATMEKGTAGTMNCTGLKKGIYFIKVQYQNKITNTNQTKTLKFIY
jgi:hypothetical protein